MFYCLLIINTHDICRVYLDRDVDIVVKRIVTTENYMFQTETDSHEDATAGILNQLLKCECLINKASNKKQLPSDT